MAQINSGLGWSCDSNYYCDDTTTTVSWHGNSGSKTKAYAGAAIVAKVYNSNGGYTGSCVISTVEDYCKTAEPEAYGSTFDRGYCIYKGLKWYIYGQGAWMAGPYNTKFPTVTVPSAYDADGYSVRNTEIGLLVLQAANVTVVPTLATNSYVKSYVESVLTDTVTKLKSLLTTEFSTNVAYDLGDIISYKDKIYICTTAHSAGAWDSSHFTETNIISEMPKTKSYNSTLSASNWIGASAPYTYSLTVNGIGADSNPVVDIVISSTVATGILEEQNWAYVTKATTSANTITFSCYETKPTVDLNIVIKDV